MIAALPTDLDSTHMPILLIVGIAIFFGTIGAGIFKRLRIPQVVGYIAIGVLAGKTGFNLISSDAIDALLPFNYFALGIIGFLIGGELHRDVFRKYGRQFFTILVSEGLGAFLLVSLLTGTVAYFVTGDVKTTLALAIIFGAISSATAPAATVSVLWEYKARGVLTTAVFAIVALDDGLALILYSIAASVASAVTGQGDGNLVTMLGHAAYELICGALLGIATGAGLNFVLRRSKDHGHSLTFIIGAVALLIGAGRWLGVDVILAAMALGVTLSNLAPRRSNEAFKIVERFAPPIYVLFFVIVGAHLQVQGMDWKMWALVLPYVVGRSAGKIIGANLGARIAGAAPVLRKYLGMCLFSQGGVAVGLAIMASTRFEGTIGSSIIMIIAVTTFIVEILGPPCVKIAITKAGEAGLNITEEDLAGTYSVADVMDSSAPHFLQSVRLGAILKTIAETTAMSYAVTNAQGKLKGMISIQELKQTFMADGLTEWLLADDLMQPIVDSVTADTPLPDAMQRMEQLQLESLPVIASKDDPQLLGLLELRATQRRLSQEILRR